MDYLGYMHAQAEMYFFLKIPSHNSETCSPTAPQSAVTALK